MEESCASCGTREAEQVQKDRVNLKLSIELAGFVLLLFFFWWHCIESIELAGFVLLFFFFLWHCIDGIQNGMKG